MRVYVTHLNVAVVLVVAFYHGNRLVKVVVGGVVLLHIVGVVGVVYHVGAGVAVPRGANRNGNVAGNAFNKINILLR